MRVSRVVVLSILSLTVFVIGQTTVGARDVVRSGPTKQVPGIQNVLVIDGSTVHNVGELRMHVGNWGLFGSMPNSAVPFSFAPSAEWPAGSGVEYLYSAGLWVGALKGGVPAVSTVQYQMEFRPTNDPVDIMYRSAEGAPGGARAPSPMADDDGDGAIDEDWLNGRDDDGDGLIDEDFAAISDQMFSCWYTDDQPGITEIYPEHNPLHLLVRQETYQWTDDRFDDFVAVVWRISNVGTDVLDDVYVALFADFDCGPRTLANYWMDDGTNFVRVPFVSPGIDPPYLDIAYGYDVDGDGGQTPAYLGMMMLDHPTDPAGVTAPTRVGVTTYANFSGDQSFEEGGDPTNDFERYEVLSQQIIERGIELPRDIRAVACTGPFSELLPGETMTVTVAFVAGQGLEGMVANARAAKRLYDADWYPDGSVPVFVTSFDASAGDRGVDLAWDLYADEGIQGFNIYRRGGAAEHDVILNGGMQVPASERSFTDLEVNPGESYEYRLGVVLMDGSEVYSQLVTVTTVAPGFVLRQNTPNPFAAATTIEYAITERAAVSLAIFDTAGRRVKSLVDAVQDPKTEGYSISWDGTNDKGEAVASGVYVYRLKAGRAIVSKKMMLLK
jgi:hypothetical protein